MIPLSPDRALASPAEADALLGEIDRLMDALLAIIESETKLLRAGKVKEAARLEGEKAELARGYMAALETVKANGDFLGEVAPERIEKLKRRHETFRDRLDANLRILGTVKQVAEDLARSVAEEMARGNRATTYGASATGTAAQPAVRPIAVDRAL